MSIFSSHRSRYTTLKITNFGPISNGTITTKPLTILVGPNGCGKSHVATLVYTIGKAESIRPYDLAGASDLELNDIFHDPAERILEQLSVDFAQIIESDIYKRYVDYIVNAFFGMLYDALLIEPKRLMRFGQNRFTLDITSAIINGNIQYSTESTKIKFQERNIFHLKYVFDKHPMQPMRYDEEGNQVKVHLSSPEAADKQMLLSEIWSSMRNIFRGLPKKRAIYLPAERGGLTMAQRSLTLHYYNMRGSTHVSSPDPNLPSVATDFLGKLFMSTRRMSTFADLARDFETRALKGTITNKSNTSSALDIIFIQNGKEIPLNVSAASVKDVAALILYLKYAAEPHDMLVLEEPEVCLHPNNQRRLARLLARLTNAGFNLVVTTHSPYFLEQLSHCVMGSTIQNEKRKKILANDECIKIDHIAVYEFAPHGDGYEILPVPVTQDGIPQTEFTNVDDDLYNELVQLRQADE